MSAKLRYYQERIIALWNGGASVSPIVQILRDEGRITTHATIRHVVYAILLLLKTSIPATIPDVSSPLYSLVSSFVERFIQADLLLSSDSNVNFF